MRYTSLVVIALCALACAETPSGVGGPQATQTASLQPPVESVALMDGSVNEMESVRILAYSIGPDQGFVYQPSGMQACGTGAVILYDPDYSNGQMEVEWQRNCDPTYTASDPMYYNGGTVDVWLVADGVSTHVTTLQGSFEEVYLEIPAGEEITFRAQAFPTSGYYLAHWDAIGTYYYSNPLIRTESSGGGQYHAVLMAN